MQNAVVSFTLNGKPVNAALDASGTLLVYLREIAGLMGTKSGCQTGHCGACTVLLDGKPTRSCTLPLAKVEGKHVLTIEGLQASGGTLHPIAQAFLDAGAVQCGFCTPAMILTTKALLDSRPHPSRMQIFQAFSHTYCRCTGYTKIIKAVELAGERLDPGFPANLENLEESVIIPQTFGDTSPSYAMLGKRQADWDGIRKVTGQLGYADDLHMPSMLVARPVFSAYPHATIDALDYSQALCVPGVLAVLTAKDVPGVNGFGMVEADQPVLCATEVRFIGDVVALVVGESREAAEQGAGKVKVSYTPLAGIFSIDGSDAENHILKEINHEKGDIQTVRKQDGLLHLKGHFETTWVEHAYLEPESVLAYPQNGKLVVKTPTQAPFELRRQIAAVLAKPLDSVRIIVTPLGGGFGGKGDATVQPLAALAAELLQQPVKITLSRAESLVMSTKKHPYHMDYSIGLSQDGRLVYVDADLRSDGGAYANLSPRVIDQSSIFAVGPYRVDAARVRGRCFRTNNVLSSAMRGFGINQVSFAMEVLLDQAAEQLGMDPFELRERNALVVGDSTFSGETLFDSVGMLDTIRVCRSELKRVLARHAGQYPKPHTVLGYGMASCFKNVGAGKGRVDNAGATITRTEEGRYLLSVSGVDMGQGFRTAMVQLASQTLGVDPSLIEVSNGDTDTTSLHGSAVGERQTLVSGMAVVKACEVLIEKMMAEPTQQSLSVHYNHEAPRTFSLGDEQGRRSVVPNAYKNYPAYTYATQAVILAVDTQTGKVQILDVIVANDAGKVLNPTVLEGQIEGCCSMGIGYALSEHFSVEEGLPTTKHFGALGLPRMESTPFYHISLIEDPEPGGPYGAKGISEVGTVPMTAAIINALYQAVGVRFTSLPVRSQDILDALQGKSSEDRPHECVAYHNPNPDEEDSERPILP